MRKLDGGVRMSCRLPSFQPGRVEPRAGRVANSIREGLPLRPFVRGGRGRSVERGAIDREVIEEQRDMMTIKARGLKACGLTVLLSMVSFEPASGQEYSMKLDAPALVGREQTFDVVLRGTSALGLVGFVSNISFDPQALSLDAHSFAGTDMGEPEIGRVIDDLPGTVVVAVALRATANRLAMTFIPVIMGAVIEVVGLENAFLVIGGTLLVLLAIVSLIIRRSPSYRDG